MTFEDLDFLYDLKREGIKLGLDVMKELSAGMNNRHKEFNSFHIAGTNGKGSVSCFIYNILSQRYRSGLYTSPHLVNFNERIVAGREFISDRYVEEFIHKYRHLIESLKETSRNPTFFEATTLMAFSFFADEKCEFASIEVGLGGRLDSTNIIFPVVSTITSIGYEHTDKLGTSLTDIAFEKAGIIKQGVPVVLSDKKPEVVSAIKKVAARTSSRVILTGKDYKTKDLTCGISGTKCTVISPTSEYRIETDLIGDFQVDNIISAIATMEAASVQGIGEREIETGIRNSRWPARLEIIRKDPTVVVDCAHNPQAVNALARNWKRISGEKPLLVMGLMMDKDLFTIIHKFSEISDEVIFTTPDEPERAADPEFLNRISAGMFTKSRVIPDPQVAYETALESGKTVLIAGSMYLVGIIKKLEKSNLKPFK